MAIFVILWSYLLTTKLSCLQKNNFGHTNQGTLEKQESICPYCNYKARALHKLKIHIDSKHQGNLLKGIHYKTVRR